MAFNFKKLMEEKDSPERTKKHHVFLASMLIRSAPADMQKEWKNYMVAEDIHDALRLLSEIEGSGIVLEKWSYLIDRSQELDTVNLSLALKEAKDALRKLED